MWIPAYVNPGLNMSARQNRMPCRNVALQSFALAAGTTSSTTLNSPYACITPNKGRLWVHRHNQYQGQTSQDHSKTTSRPMTTQNHSKTDHFQDHPKDHSRSTHWTVSRPLRSHGKTTPGPLQSQQSSRSSPVLYYFCTTKANFRDTTAEMTTVLHFETRRLMRLKKRRHTKLHKRHQATTVRFSGPTVRPSKCALATALHLRAAA